MASTAPSSSGFGKKRQKKGQRQQEVTNVAESTRIRIAQVLEQFRVSNDEVYTFESNLSNRDRAAVHMLCRKMGMKSKSSGRGDQRRISVFKTKQNVDALKGKDMLSCFKFSEEANDVLQDLFTRYPPGDGETSEQVVGKHSKKVDKLRRRKDDMFCKPAMNKSEIAKRVESLASRIENNPNLRQITAQRSKLPIASFKDVITSNVESNQVVLISGETGCGKTTQVPQFILDHMWGKGETCKIVCTQPRRISATSVSERISCERGETVGDTVGYKIRLESRGGRQSSIMFCTNGVLLRVLVTNGSASFNKEAPRKMGKDDISDITHIIVVLIILIFN
ncbi:hypothetical protein HAX54_006656 [Datura stramonium]|uniref:RNA helicase n=1 Tax=Datura stramonium TaxID=4076 RepID=A0ABS8TAM5_DATST|nr:hypothetical protein [Datura stramonium]